MATSLRPVSTIEFALSAEGEAINNRALRDLMKRNSDTWPQLSQAESMLGIMIINGIAKTYHRRVINELATQPLSTLSLAGLRYVKHVDRLVRIEPAFRSLVPPNISADNHDALSSYADLLFADYGQGRSGRPRTFEFTESIAGMAIAQSPYKATAESRQPAKEFFMDVMRLGFFALERANEADLNPEISQLMASQASTGELTELS